MCSNLTVLQTSETSEERAFCYSMNDLSKIFGRNIETETRDTHDLQGAISFPIQLRMNYLEKVPVFFVKKKKFQR